MSLFAHRPDWQMQWCRWCLLGFLQGALVSLRPQAAFPRSWLPSLAHGCHAQGCLAEGWAVRSSLKRLRPKWGFRAEPYVAFQREVKLHKSHITSRGFFHPVTSKQCRAFPEGVMHRNQDSCITPANTTAALWLLWELPRVSSAFKRGKKMPEKVVFHLFFSEGEVPWIWSPLHCPCEHLW